MSSVRPQNLCQVRKKSGRDIYGQSTLAAPVTERCAIVKSRLESQHTTVRADASASRAYADEFVSQNKILLMPSTRAEIDDRLDVAGVSLRIKTKFPRFDVWGRLDHYEVTGEVWA